jgi:Zn-dependent protease with chaperone function
MTLQRGIVLTAAAVFGLGCVAWVGNCVDRATCAGAATEPWLPVLFAAAIPTAGIFLGLCAARSGYLLWRASGRLATFESIPAPDNLATAMEAADVENVSCLAEVQPLAFCAGALKPKVHVTTGLLQVLSGPELEAVLRHEEHHRRQRHPLMRALLIGTAEVMFFLPVVGWLVERVLDDAELAADRAAILYVGNQAVAAALWRVGSPTMPTPRQAIGFGGAAELRAAQLLGDTLPARRPTARVWLQSLAGIGVAIEVGLCASGAAASYIH